MTLDTYLAECERRWQEKSQGCGLAAMKAWFLQEAERQWKESQIPNGLGVVSRRPADGRKADQSNALARRSDAKGITTAEGVAGHVAWQQVDERNTGHQGVA